MNLHLQEYTRSRQSAISTSFGIPTYRWTLGTVHINLDDVSSAHGDDLNSFVKGERQIGLGGKVTITAPVFAELKPSVQQMFSSSGRKWEHGGKHELHVTDLFEYPTKISASAAFTWEEWWNLINTLVAQLQRPESGLMPHLLVGISRGGVAVCDFVSRQLNKPFVTLWAERYCYDLTVSYSSQENAETKRALHALVENHGIRKILIIDDFCKSGATLQKACEFIREATADLKTQPTIRTAVLAVDFSTNRVLSPDYYVIEVEKDFPYGPR
jgi:hypoxanthine phosphoribosyltransferase